MGKKFDFDYVVIGSGAAGSTAALMAAGAGLKVALIEEKEWGGSNLNTRDIPYAAGLHFSHLYAEAVRGARFGLSSANLRYNYPTAVHWQTVAAKRAGAGSAKEFEDAGIKCIKGYAHFINPFELAIGEKGNISAKKFLIATGSQTAAGGIAGLENTKCLTPTSALVVNRIPKVVLIVGAGATGCEIAQYYAELGSKVLLAELANRILPQEDAEVGELMEHYLTKQLKVKVLTESRVTTVAKDRVSKKVIFMRGGQEKQVRVEEIILATGSAPATDLGLENAGVKYTKMGIKVEPTLQTSAKHIYAAGDVLGGNKSSTEKASYEAAVATANIVNRAKNAVDYRGFVRMVNTFPPVASVGLTEDDCLKRDLKYKSTIVLLNTTSASNTSDFRAGFIKLIANRERRIIGATVVAPQADLIIQEIVLAMRNRISVVELASTPHVAMSWSELVRIAARRLSR